MSRSYQQYCALARALDVVGDRWTMLIVRNLLLGPLRYNELRQTLPSIATNLLADRLRHLAEHELIAQPDGDAYALTPAGQALEGPLFALADWGEAHAWGPPRDGEHLHPRWLLTSMRRKIRPGAERATILMRTPDRDYLIVCGPHPTVTARDPAPSTTPMTCDLEVTGETPRQLVGALIGALTRPEHAATARAARQSLGEWGPISALSIL